MKFLVIGLGSMGRRRIRCLQHLGEKDIIGFDLRKDRCQESSSKYGIKTFADFSGAAAEDPDVFIISVPSNLHHGYAMEAAKRNKHFFTESNFLPEGIDDLVAVEDKSGRVTVPSFTMPHHPFFKLMKDFADRRFGEIYFFTYHLSSYLPSWHPWEDYRNVYYSMKETAGSSEMVAFELTSIVWLFGEVEEVSAFKAKRSSLQIDFADTYQIILKFKNGILGHLLIEIASRPSERDIRVMGEKGTLHWNSEEEVLRWFDNEKQGWEEHRGNSGIVEPGYSVHTHEEMYIAEIDDFLKAIRGTKAYPYTFRMEKRIIEILVAIEKSISERRVVGVKHEKSPCVPL